MMSDVYVPEFLMDLSNVRLALLDAGDVEGAALCAMAYDVVVSQWNEGEAFDRPPLSAGV
jgi:hypothetical protein